MGSQSSRPHQPGHRQNQSQSRHCTELKADIPNPLRITKQNQVHGHQQTAQRLDLSLQGKTCQSTCAHYRSPNDAGLQSGEPDVDGQGYESSDLPEFEVGAIAMRLKPTPISKTRETQTLPEYAPAPLE